MSPKTEPCVYPRTGNLMIDALVRYGFDGKKESLRLATVAENSAEDARNELIANLNFLTHEVLKDESVSPVFQMYYGNKYPDYFNVYSNQNRSEESSMAKQFDLGERGGLPLQAFRESTRLAKLNPGKMILSLSLPGKAGYDDDPHNEFNKIEYNTTQFYHLYYDIAKDIVYSSAVTWSAEDLSVDILNRFGISHTPPDYIDEYFFELSRLGKLRADFSDEEVIKSSKVLWYLRQPAVTGLDVNDYLDTIKDEFGDRVGYTNHFNEHFTVAAISDSLRDKFGDAYEGMDHKEMIVEKVISDLKISDNSRWSQKIVDDAYFLTMKYFAQINNIQMLELAGSCGGNSVSAGSLDRFLSSSNGDYQYGLNSWSSFGRLYQNEMTRLLGAGLFSICGVPGCNSLEDHFHCPDFVFGGCGCPIPSGYGIEICPTCGLTKDEFKEKTNIDCD